MKKRTLEFMQIQYSDDSPKSRPLASRHRLTSIVIIMAFFVIEMSTDIYVPCLPEMTHFFEVDESVTLMTLSAFLFGFSLLGFLSGPLSDSYGRRFVMRSGVVIFLLGSIGCWWMYSIYELILSRFFQGIGGGIVVVVATAIVKDLFDDKNCSRILSFMGMLTALSPMIAPIFGGEIAALMGWQANFTVIAICAALMVITSWFFLPESLPLKQRNTFTPKKMVLTYVELLCRVEVIGFSLISAITYASLWAWIAGAPFYFIEQLGIASTKYGYYAAIGPLAYVLGSLINQQLIDRLGVRKMLRLGIWSLLLGCLSLFIVVAVVPDSLLLIYLSFCFYGIGLAPVFANAVTKAIDVAPHQRGSASALLNTLEMTLAALSTFIVGQMSNGTLIPPITLMTIGSILCYVLYIWLRRRKKILQTETAIF